MRDLREPALRALEWIDGYGDADGDGFVEYRRRVARGLVNQSWKDSGDSQLFHDGRHAEAPIAPARCRATSTTPSCGWPSWPARSGASASWPTVSSGRRPSFGSASTRRFGASARGGYYALALDADKQRVDSLTSNIGHLLWSGIVPPDASMRSSTS